MKPFLTFGAILACAALFVVPAAAQRGGRGSALDGSLAPQGAMTHPLGGYAGGSSGVGGNRFRGAGRPAVGPYIYPYGYSYYIPGYFDSPGANAWYDPYYGDAALSPALPYATAPAVQPAAPQPVIINQYFGVQGPQAQSGGPDAAGNTQAPGNVIGTPQNYYLIAYKNHAIYSALAYWVEDKTLHYVTTQNTHNQASLDLIDLNLTKSLNRANEVPFALPGQ
jgi:hypothetical protein